MHKEQFEMDDRNEPTEPEGITGGGRPHVDADTALVSTDSTVVENRFSRTRTQIVDKLARFRESKAFRPVAIGVAAAVVLGVGLAMYLPWELSKVALPDVSKMTLTEAKAELKRLDIDVQVDVENGPKSTLADFWSVSGQNPSAGTRVLPNSLVTLKGSLVKVTVPSLTTLSSVASATKLLAASGLEGKVSYGYVDGSTIPGIESIDNATLTSFLAGSGIRGDARSDGSLFTVEVTAKFLTSTMANVVIPSDIAGTKMTAGSTVDLILVPPVTIVPELTGVSVAEAKTALGKAYLSGSFGSSEDWYSVQSQDAPAGSLYMIGSGAITLSASPDLGAFPALDGGTWAQIIKNPDGYVGTRALLYGKVVQFDVNTGACAFRMNTGPAETEYSFDYDQNTYVHAGAADCALLGPIVQDDHLRIWATVTGAYTYSTSIGGSATALEVDIWHFDELARQRY